MDTADDFAFHARIVKRLLKNANATSCRRHRRMALSILHWTLARSRAASHSAGGMQLALPVFGFMTDLEVRILCYVVQKNCQMPTDGPKRGHL